MRYELKDTVRIIPGVGPAIEAALQRLDIVTVGDLLQWYPREYIDGTNPVPIMDAPEETLVAIRAVVLHAEVKRTKNRNISIVDATVSDSSGELTVQWFNQRFILPKLIPGSEWLLIGQIKRFRGERIMQSPLMETEPKILAVYGQTAGVTSKSLRSYIGWCLENVDQGEVDLPEGVRREQSIVSRDDALRMLHTPKTQIDIHKGREYAAFAEVFWFYCRTLQMAQENKDSSGIDIFPDIEWLKEAVLALPFELTPGQKRAVWDIVQDMHTGRPMTRLLNGDVGSGKTVVAALAAAVVAKAGYRTIFLVPTEILAKQHQEKIAQLLRSAGITVDLWTANSKEKTGADIVIGTHAVLQDSFSLERLGLLVIDEQHRFGVRQRKLLRQQSAQVPHVLSMTATPIPRSLALALYGGLAMSILKDKPQGRLPIVTQLIYPSERIRLHQRIMTELGRGHQVFVVCPLIEEKRTTSSDEESVDATLWDVMDEAERVAKERKTVMAEAERLRSQHPEYGTVGVIHGKLKADEKRNIMDQMAKGEINVLVATSVIEVGIDIPKATVIVIEGAERFGLAQLHQFRGRVGRSGMQSYCFLCPDHYSAQAAQRLEALVESESGFDIAEADLAQRGPGDVAGLAQSGLPDFRMASLTDVDFLTRVKGVAETFIQQHPEFMGKLAQLSTYSAVTGGLE